MKKLTAFKWYYNDDTQTFTGKEYTVLFSRETGVDKIISVHAVERDSLNRIDITLAETAGGQLECFIDGMFDWDELEGEAVTPIRDKYFAKAAQIVKFHAESYRS